MALCKCRSPCEETSPRPTPCLLPSTVEGASVRSKSLRDVERTRCHYLFNAGSRQWIGRLLDFSTQLACLLQVTLLRPYFSTRTRNDSLRDALQLALGRPDDLDDSTMTLGSFPSSVVSREIKFRHDQTR
mmetsp:Transcript_24392/g.54579  ORF Transcript_24392/g.54579 Transcript_24392/m.54579 type:complete len:130 (-) Transcript_24392:92-481(-)